MTNLDILVLDYSPYLNIFTFFICLHFTASRDVNVPVRDDTDFVIKMVRNILKQNKYNY